MTRDGRVEVLLRPDNSDYWKFSSVLVLEDIRKAGIDLDREFTVEVDEILHQVRLTQARIE